MGNQNTSNPGQRFNMLQELMRNANLAWHLLLDPRVSILAKMVPAAALVYVISPIDLIPDWIVGLGQLDDIAVVLLSIRLFIAMCPPEVVQWYRNQLGQQEPPKSDTSDGQTVDSTYRVIDE